MDKKVIERLLASKKEAEEADYQDGLESGKKWAQKAADWKELDRLARVYRGLGQDFEKVLYGDEGGDAFFAETVSNSENDLDPKTWAEFWKDQSGRSAPSLKFVHGFWMGAVEVYDAMPR